MNKTALSAIVLYIAALKCSPGDLEVAPTPGEHDRPNALTHRGNLSEKSPLSAYRTQEDRRKFTSTSVTTSTGMPFR